MKKKKWEYERVSEGTGHEDDMHGFHTCQKCGGKLRICCPCHQECLECRGLVKTKRPKAGKWEKTEVLK